MKKIGRLKLTCIIFAWLYGMQVICVYPRILQEEDVISEGRTHGVTLQLQNSYHNFGFVPLIGLIALLDRGVYVKTNTARYRVAFGDTWDRWDFDNHVLTVKEGIATLEGDFWWEGAASECKLD